MKVKNFLRAVARFTRDKEGVSAMEYAIVVGVVVAGVGGAVYAFTGDVTTAVATIGSTVETGATNIPALPAPATPTPVILHA